MIGLFALMLRITIKLTVLMVVLFGFLAWFMLWFSVWAIAMCIPSTRLTAKSWKAPTIPHLHRLL